MKEESTDVPYELKLGRLDLHNGNRCRGIARRFESAVADIVGPQSFNHVGCQNLGIVAKLLVDFSIVLARAVRRPISTARKYPLPEVC